MFQTWRNLNTMLSPPSLLSTRPHHTHTHTLHPEQPEGDATAGGLLAQMSCTGCSIRTHSPPPPTRPKDRRPSQRHRTRVSFYRNLESDWSQQTACDIAGSIQKLHLNSVVMAAAPISAGRWSRVDKRACRV